MTEHCFENSFVKLYYHKFGNGEKVMLCFHGYGMHGKQFKILEQGLGTSYTFIGFDLFFHCQTRLKNQSLQAIKDGLSKTKLAELIVEFCDHEQIGRFSVLGYSMGTHYATAVAEELAHRINDYIVVAPSSLNPGWLLNYFSNNRFGNMIIRKLAYSPTALLNMLALSRKIRLLDEAGFHILSKEFANEQSRYSFYASCTYLRHLDTDQPKLLSALNEQHIRSVFIFGQRDRMYPPKIGADFIKLVRNVHTLVLDENHEMIKDLFALELTRILI